LRRAGVGSPRPFCYKIGRGKCNVDMDTSIALGWLVPSRNSIQR
jgi:hypothetical protein